MSLEDFDLLSPGPTKQATPGAPKRSRSVFLQKKTTHIEIDLSDTESDDEKTKHGTPKKVLKPRSILPELNGADPGVSGIDIKTIDPPKDSFLHQALEDAKRHLVVHKTPPRPGRPIKVSVSPSPLKPIRGWCSVCLGVFKMPHDTCPATLTPGTALSAELNEEFGIDLDSPIGMIKYKPLEEKEKKVKKSERTEQNVKDLEDMEMETETLEPSTQESHSELVSPCTKTVKSKKGSKVSV